MIDFNQFDKKIIDRKIDLNFKDINIAENQNTGNLLNSREFEIITTDLKRNGKNGLYEFSADSLVYNSAKHNILLKGIKINPLLKPEEFSGRIGFQTDFLKVTTDFLELAGIDESKWIDDKIVSGKKLQIGATDMYIYRNKRYPFNHNQRPPWPQELLKDIDQPFVFDSVILLPSVIKYSELMDISDTPGNLEFNKLTFTAGKISNIPDNTTKHFNIKARAELYKTAPVSLNVNFDLSSHNYYHTVSGKIGPMPFSILNNMVTKSAPISIESGQLNRFDFNLKLNDKKAEGELFFGFDDFKINVLEYNDSGAKKSKLATFWANNMMLNSKNPKGNTLLPEKITYERDVERSIINYWWKSIFTGAKQALGIKPDDNLQGVDTEN